LLSAKRKSLSKIIYLLLIFPSIVHAIPVDWQGVFGADFNGLTNFRFVSKESPGTDVSVAGPQAPGDKPNASFESYLIKLLPNFTINDTASFKAELSTGYARSGFFGDGQRYDYKNDQFGDVLYYFNTFGLKNFVTFNRFWMELYSDTATYGIGRMSMNWGMGAIYNGGENTWDRFANVRDNLVIKIKLGNFALDPFVAKIGEGNSLTSATYAIEFGIPVTYEVPESDMKMGFIWTKKNLAAQNDVVVTPYAPPPATPPNTTPTYLGSSGVNIFDLYFNKSFGKLGLEFEVPFFSGRLGNFRNQPGDTNYSSMAALFNLEFKFSQSFKMGLDLGMIPGDNPADAKFTSVYLNPNYHIANILFRYGQQGIADSDNYSVWDIYVANTNFLKIYAEFLTEKWALNLSAIYAKADKVATTGGQYVVYERNTYPITAIADQSKNMGTEVDFNFTYAWNNEVRIGGELGYLLTGEYFGFNNTATPYKTENPFLLKINAAVTF
jgi:hypothetical protein